MTTDLRTITDRINQFQLASPSKFKVQFFGGPSGVNLGFDGGDASIIVEDVTMPGRTLSTVERRSFGPVQELPYERTFGGDIEVVFKLMGSSNDSFNIRVAMEKWMDEIIGAGLRDTNTGMIMQDRKQYVCDMRIQVFSQDFRTPSLTLRCFEVFPKTINSISLSDNTTDSYVRQSANFSYRDYEIE